MKSLTKQLNLICVMLSLVYRLKAVNSMLMKNNIISLGKMELPKQNKTYSF